MEEHQINANLKVFGANERDCLTYKIDALGSQTTHSVCYNVTDLRSITYYDHDFDIDIRRISSNYNLKVDVYQTELICDPRATLVYGRWYCGRFVFGLK
ncbi:hypothetical protein [Soonwooa sp.]|uniref:hypothetical protein n=1 Tax=Soonwooa sp. TaxID=1938592 RepID=UPI0028AEE54F|nr:hypothetical protein [Soonwooa sp.]